MEKQERSYDPSRPIWEQDPDAINPYKKQSEQGFVFIKDKSELEKYRALLDEALVKPDELIPGQDKTSYTAAELLAISEAECERHYAEKCPGDWDKPTPIKTYPPQDGDPEWRTICVIGKWEISDKGDLLCNKRNHDNYIISHNRLRENDWLLHLAGKGWFDTQTYEDFKRAYFVACKIARIKPVSWARTHKDINNY